MVLFFLTLYLTSQMDYSVSQAGQMLGIYGAGSLGGSYFGGWLSDRIGAKNVQILSLVISAFGFILLGHIHSTIGLAVTLFLLAMVNEAFRPANASALAEFCPPQLRARGFALNRLAVNLGIAIGPAVGGLLATINYTLLFWADGLTCLFAAILLWYLLPPTKMPIWQPTENEPPALSPWHDRSFLLLLILLLYLGLVFFQIFNTWPIYLRDIYLLPEDRIGVLMAFNALLIVLVEMPLVHRMERLEPIRIIALGSFLLVGGFALMPLGNTFVFALFTVLIWTVGEMLVFPLVIGFIANRAEDRNRGRYMGMYTFNFSIAFVFGPLLGTMIYDTFGPDILWYGIGGIGILVVFGFRLIHRKMG